jgi:hypothetical protein
MDRFNWKKLIDNKREDNKTKGGDKGGIGESLFKPPWIFGRKDSSNDPKEQNVEVYYEEVLSFGMSRRVQRTRPKLSYPDESAFHNRSLLATTGDHNKSIIDAILVSDNPSRTLEERKPIIEEVRNYMVETGYMEPDGRIDVTNTDNGVTYGQILVNYMSVYDYIRPNVGLTLHYLKPGLGDHMQVAPGEDQLHVYMKPDSNNTHFFGMGAEIEPGAWKPNPEFIIHGRLAGGSSGEQKLEMEMVDQQSLSRRGAQAPKKFHNRRLLETTTDENNCAIDAILRSDNPSRSSREREHIIKQVRDYMVGEGYVKRGEQIEVDTMTDDGVTHGKKIVDFLSKNNYIRENAGLTVHYLLEYEAMGDHMQVAPGPDQLHIYRAYPERDRNDRSRDNAHFWGMGPEIEPGAWNSQYDHEEVIKDSISTSSSSHRESSGGRQEVEMVDQWSLEDK